MAHHCPRCENEPLRPLLVSEVEVETCPRCHGLWFDREVLGRLLNSRTKPASTKAGNSPLECAACKTALQVRNAFAYEGDAYCAACRPPSAEPCRPPGG